MKTHEEMLAMEGEIYEDMRKRGLLFSTNRTRSAQWLHYALMGLALLSIGILYLQGNTWFAFYWPALFAWFVWERLGDAKLLDRMAKLLNDGTTLESAQNKLILKLNNQNKELLDICQALKTHIDEKANEEKDNAIQS